MRPVSWGKEWRKTAVTRQARMQPLSVNEAWSMDFVAEQLADGTKIYKLTIICTREALAIVVDNRLPSEDIVALLDGLVGRRPAPTCLFVDNGSEFSGQLLCLWAYDHKPKFDFIRSGKPTDNCFIETFNGSMRDECRNVFWFASIAEARPLSRTVRGLQ